MGPSVIQRAVGHAPVRFILSGAANTAITFVAYVGLLSVVPYAVAYTIAFALGIAIAYALNRFFVFRSGGGLVTMSLFPFVYVIQYLLGLAVAFVWVSLLGLPAELASLAAALVALPVTYLLSRRLFAHAR